MNRVESPFYSQVSRPDGFILNSRFTIGIKPVFPKGVFTVLLVKAYDSTTDRSTGISTGINPVIVRSNYKSQQDLPPFKQKVFLGCFYAVPYATK